MHGEVKTYYLTPEELKAYREKYPPKKNPKKLKKKEPFSNIYDLKKKGSGVDETG